MIGRTSFFCALLGSCTFLLACQKSLPAPTSTKASNNPSVDVEKKLAASDADIQAPSDVGILPVAPEQIGLGTLAVALELGAGDSATIDYDEPIQVVLTNTGNQPVRIWEPNSERDWNQLTFQFKKSSTSIPIIVAHRVVDAKMFWSSERNESTFEYPMFEIDPGEKLPIEVIFGERRYGDLAWKGLPSPNTKDRFTISAIFNCEISGDTRRQHIWVGKVSSEPQPIRFVSSRLKTPHDYLRSQFPEKAIELMQANPELISARDDNERLPLHLAVQEHHAGVVKWLLEHGADINADSMNGFTPLYFADQPEMVRLLLNYNPKLTPRKMGDTPLQEAVERYLNGYNESERNRWREIIAVFRDAGADYDLISAIYLGDLIRIKEILKTSPEFAHEFQSDTPLRIAAKWGHFEICKYLIEEFHVDVDDFEKGGGFPIILTALARPDIVKLLIENGADLETRITWQGGRSGARVIKDDATLLHYAAEDGVPETVTLLIDSDVDIFATDQVDYEFDETLTALEVAARSGMVDNSIAILNHPQFDKGNEKTKKRILDSSLIKSLYSQISVDNPDRSRLAKALLEKGADPNASRDGATAMQLAAQVIYPDSEAENKELIEAIGVLRDYGAKVDFVTAVAIGDDSLVAKMLQKNPDMANSRRPDGYPVLHVAIEMNYGKIVEHLIKAGCDLEIGNKSEDTGNEGETALHCAASWDRYEIGTMLIAAGANVNAQNAGGETPLHDAANMANARMIRLLLENGAKIDAKDTDGQTPLEFSSKSQKARRAFEEFRKKSDQK